MGSGWAAYAMEHGTWFMEPRYARQAPIDYSGLYSMNAAGNPRRATSFLDDCYDGPGPLILKVVSGSRVMPNSSNSLS
jgi:hypothetical protein